MTPGCQDPCADDVEPGWTPDGGHLTFTRVVGPFDLPSDSARSAVLQGIATVPMDCTSLAACTAQIRYVTHNGAGPTFSANPGWSPSGRRIAFSEWNDTTFADIWTARPDGSDRRRVTTSPLWDFRPSWGVAPFERG